MSPAQKQLLLAKPLNEVKKATWKVFSEYIRRRYADQQGIAICCSCKKPKHWKELQAGHWPSIDGRNNSILFAEKGVHQQCGQCNTYKHGNPAGYDEYMHEHYPQKVMDDLLKLKHKTVIYDKNDYIKMIDKWMAKIQTFDEGQNYR